MKPPTGGPSTGATRAGHVIVAIVRIRSSLGVVLRTIRRPTGTIIAPPAPWRMRAAVNMPSDWLSPHRIEATVKMTIAAAKTLRAPKRSATHPLTGISIAKVRR